MNGAKGLGENCQFPECIRPATHSVDDGEGTVFLLCARHTGITVDQHPYQDELIVKELYK